ncbi:MAG: zinc-binding dehydrogenase [Saprospiraceae bacterium]|nr:zinc-binding dehydrogenase [Saprospiraceae bacterium]
MKAWIINDIGQSPVLQRVDLNEVKDSEVVLSVMASAINHRDIWITKGLYPDIKTGIVLGSDACGTYDGKTYIINPGLDWGSDQAVQSRDFNVLGMPINGTFAEQIVINKKYLYPKPLHLNAEEAAALPLAGVTAYRALMIKTKPQKGEKVLVSGIGGGVALFAMQFAIACGCEVFVTSSSDQKLEKALQLGAISGYNYSNPDWAKQLMADHGGVDIVIDGACGNGFNNLVKICNPGARIAFYGGSAGKIDGLNPQLIFWRQITISGTTMGSDQDFFDMLAFINKHKIVPVIDEVIDFENISKGFNKMASGSQFGKIVFKH